MSDEPTEPHAAERSRWHRRLPVLLALAAVGAALAVAVLTTIGGSSPSTVTHAATVRRPSPPPARQARRRRRRTVPGTLSFQATGSALPVALAGSAAAAPGGGNALVLGGVDASGASSDRAIVISAGHFAGESKLARKLHHAAAGGIAGTVYLFGGQGAQTSASIMQVDPLGGTQVVGRLPTPTADAGVAVVAGTAYVVGGSDGSQPLTSIVSWQPGLTAHVVAQLPRALSFPAVAAADGQVIIAGGTTSAGPSRAILAFDPSSQQVSGLTVLPSPVTHAAAASLNGLVYLLGGESGGQGTQTDHIESFDPQTATVSAAGLLPSPLSDAAAVTQGNTILLAGGLDDAGQVHDQIYRGSAALSGGT